MEMSGWTHETVKSGSGGLHRVGKSIVVFVAVCVLTTQFTGCVAAPVRARPPLAEQGVAYLYLQPLSADSVRLSFTLESISAVKESGEEVPLMLRVREISLRSVSRERLLAQGELPPGRYRGFSVKVEKALLAAEEDNAALQASEGPARIEIPFVVARRKANVITLSFRYGESLEGGVVFTPRFTAGPAAKVPRGLLGFVVNRGSNTVTVFDKISGRVSDVVPTGATPGGMAIDFIGGGRAYVAVSGADVVQVIDLLRAEVIHEIRLTMGDQPVELALTPDGNTLITVNAGSNTVSFIDTASQFERDRISIPAGPRSILLDAAGRRAYVFNTGGSAVTVLDVPNRIVAATVATESAPLRGQLNRRGDRLYVIHEWSPTLLVIDTATLAVVRRETIGMGFQAMKVDPGNDWIYLGRRGGNEVVILDPFTLMPTRHLDSGGEVARMTIDGQEKSLLMILPGRESLRIVDLIRHATRAEVDVGEDPFWVAVMGER